MHIPTGFILERVVTLSCRETAREDRDRLRFRRRLPLRGAQSIADRVGDRRIGELALERLACGRALLIGEGAKKRGQSELAFER